MRASPGPGGESSFFSLINSSIFIFNDFNGLQLFTEKVMRFLMVSLLWRVGGGGTDFLFVFVFLHGGFE